MRLLEKALFPPCVTAERLAKTGNRNFHSPIHQLTDNHNFLFTDPVISSISSLTLTISFFTSLLMPFASIPCFSELRITSDLISLVAFLMLRIPLPSPLATSGILSAPNTITRIKTMKAISVLLIKRGSVCMGTNILRKSITGKTGPLKWRTKNDIFKVFYKVFSICLSGSATPDHRQAVSPVNGRKLLPI